MPRLYSKKFLLLSAWWRINWIYFLLLGLVLAFNNARVNAQAVWESSSPTSNQGDDSSNSPTFTRPASTAAGDLLVVAIFDEKGSGVTWTPPTGWQLIRTTNNSGNFGVKTFLKLQLRANLILMFFHLPPQGYFLDQSVGLQMLIPSIPSG